MGYVATIAVHHNLRDMIYLMKDQDMTTLDTLTGDLQRKETAADAARKAQHDRIRAILKAATYTDADGRPRVEYGVLSAVAARTGYTPQHLDRIKNGQTTGNKPARRRAAPPTSTTESMS
jgi:hypothetical protein